MNGGIHPPIPHITLWRARERIYFYHPVSGNNWYDLDCTASFIRTGLFVESSITVFSSVGSLLLGYLFYSLPTGLYNRMNDIRYGQGTFVECGNKRNA
jgi:hypothetical protein